MDVRCLWLNCHRLSAPNPPFQALPGAAGVGLGNRPCALPAGSALGFPRWGARGRLRSRRTEDDPPACGPVGMPRAMLLPSRNSSPSHLRQLPVFSFSNTVKMNFIMPLRHPGPSNAPVRDSNLFPFFPDPNGGSCSLPLSAP